MRYNRGPAKNFWCRYIIHKLPTWVRRMLLKDAAVHLSTKTDAAYIDALLDDDDPKETK